MISGCDPGHSRSANHYVGFRVRHSRLPSLDLNRKEINHKDHKDLRDLRDGFSLYKSRLVRFIFLHMKKTAFVTYSNLPNLSKDDLLAADALRRLGVETHSAVW